MLRQACIAQSLSIVLSGLVCGCAGEPDSIHLTDLPARSARAGGGAASQFDNAIDTAGTGSDLQVIEGDAGPTLCDVVQLVASPQVPDMMIVLDRSSSMQEGGRWQPSVSAVRSLAMKLENSVRFGLALFPGGSGFGNTNGFPALLSCLSAPDQQKCLRDLSPGGGLLCTPGEIVVPVAASNAAAITRALNQTSPSGGTPTSDTLLKLVDSYAMADVEPDAEAHAKYVLLVTDGAPTCPSGNGSQTTQPDIDATNAAIDKLRGQRVRTYVIGYDTTGPGNEMLASVLDGFAMRGGTGDDKHRPVENEASLLSEFQKIASSIASCDFRLDKAPARADYVLVQLDGEQLNLDAADGWQLSGDRTIQLVGAACERFRDGSHSVSAEIRCAVVEPS